MKKYLLTIKKSLVFLWNKFFDIKIKVTNSYFILIGNLTKNIYAKPNVKSINETIDFILKNKFSVCRFGDGELKLMMGKDISFQKCTSTISKRLKEVLKNNDHSIIVCIPDIFDKLSIYENEAAKYWELHVAKNRNKWYNLLNLKKQYYNAYISRCYLGLKDKTNSKYYFDRLKLIWKDRHIVIIEGKKSRLGVGNDLFCESKDIRRILCPEENAFEEYEFILEEAKKIDKQKLILLAIGPTATILAYDLNKLGYQAIDIGHIDIEYEWFLAGVTKKERVKNKYVCEAGGGENVGDCEDRDYINQIICSVK